ncbi:MAG: histidine kinase [Brucellaceae bacterium]|nr:histidine kinase [Brucellaceae bacterium]MCO5059833.1 histidine kinase [Rhizobiaceae bacterium]
MPTLFRFLSVILFIVGLVYGAMFALVVYVEPKKGEIMVRVPPEKINPPR